MEMGEIKGGAGTSAWWNITLTLSPHSKIFCALKERKCTMRYECVCVCVCFFFLIVEWRGNCLLDLPRLRPLERADQQPQMNTSPHCLQLQIYLLGWVCCYPRWKGEWKRSSSIIKPFDNNFVLLESLPTILILLAQMLLTTSSLNISI